MNNLQTEDIKWENTPVVEQAMALAHELKLATFEDTYIKDKHLADLLIRNLGAEKAQMVANLISEDERTEETRDLLDVEPANPYE